MFAVETGIVGLGCMILLSVRVVQSLRGSLNSAISPVAFCMTAVVYALVLLLTLDQIVSNSLIVPPPAERRVVQLSFLIWLLMAACAHTVAPVRKTVRPAPSEGVG
jgi:hypothetical protein